MQPERFRGGCFNLDSLFHFVFSKESSSASVVRSSLHSQPGYTKVCTQLRHRGFSRDLFKLGVGSIVLTI